MPVEGPEEPDPIHGSGPGLGKGRKEVRGCSADNRKERALRSRSLQYRSDAWFGVTDVRSFFPFFYF